MPFSSMPSGSATSFWRAICRPWTTRAVVCGEAYSPIAGEPAPAAVGELHVGKPLDAGSGHLGDFGLVEDRVVFVALVCLARSRASPSCWAFRLVCFSRMAFRSSAEVDQDLLGDDRRQEAVQGLLGAAVGVIGQVGQGVDQGACERGRIAHLEPRLVRLALGRDANDDLRPSARPGRIAPAKASILSMPWTYAGKLICAASDSSSVRAFMRINGLALVDDFHPPVNPMFRAGGDLARSACFRRAVAARCPRARARPGPISCS